MSRLVQIDLNLETFQEGLFGLASAEQVALLATFGKIVRMTWDQVYRDKGLHWEAIQTCTGEDRLRLYSFRVTRKFRAVAPTRPSHPRRQKSRPTEW